MKILAGFALLWLAFVMFRVQQTNYAVTLTCKYAQLADGYERYPKAYFPEEYYRGCYSLKFTEEAMRKNDAQPKR